MDPVTEDIAPQYFTIITHPMDFKTMKKKLKDGKYDSIESLQVLFTKLIIDLTFILMIN